MVRKMKEMTFQEAMNFFIKEFKKAKKEEKRSEFFGYVNFLANIDKVLDLTNIKVFPQKVIWYPKEKEKKIISLQNEGKAIPQFLFGNTTFFIKTKVREEPFNPDFLLFYPLNKVLFLLEIKGKRNSIVKRTNYGYTAYKVRKTKQVREKLVETKERYQCLIYLQSFNLLFIEGVSKFKPIVFLIKCYRNGIYVRIYQSTENKYKTKLDKTGEIFIPQKALLV